MDIQLRRVKDFLESNSKNVIDLYDNQTGNTIPELSKITMQHIVEKHGDIEKFFVYVKEYHQINVVGVQKLKPNGTSHRKFQNAIILSLITNKPLEAVAANGAPVESVVAPNVATSRSYQPEPNQGLSPFPHGLSAFEIIDLKSKERDYDKIEKRERELEDRLRKKDIEIENLTKDLREVKSDLSIADKSKEMAVMMEALKKEPSMSPELLGKFADMFPVLIESLKRNPQSNVGLAGANPNLSKVKKELLEFISSNDVNDELALYMFYTNYGMATIEEFKNSVLQLVEQHQIKNAFQ